MRHISTAGTRAAVGSALALLLAAAAAWAQTVRELDSFTYPSRGAAARAWQAKEGSPAPVPVEAGTRGLMFSCPFRGLHLGLLGRQTDRVYWDRDAKFDLSAFTSFELDVACDDPAAVRSLFVYFRSGPGYYVWSDTLREPGRQTLIMLKDEFSAEGKPKGWQHVDRVRISPWRGVPANTSITAYSLTARSDSLLLVQGTASAGDPAEQKASARAARRISGWLKAAGIPHGLVRDEDVAAGRVGQARVLVLCYNPKIPAKEMTVLRDFVKRGGKLVVFYSADPALAGLMHMKLGDYKPAPKPGQWASFAFADPGAWRVPARVFQESWNIRPVSPADGSAKVIATWHDGEGNRTADPAWVASDQGLWMTHILLIDDAQAKQGMLLGLLARLDPSIWPRAARQALRQAGRIDSFRNLDYATEAIRKEAGRSGDPDQVESLLDGARALYAEMTGRYQAAEYPAAVACAQELRTKLVEAYARVQPAAPGEFRGVWDHDAAGWYPGDWDRTCAILARHGVTAIFPNVAWGGIAHYRSELLPTSDTFRRFGDQLEKCVSAAHARGLEVHAWKICWNLDGAPPELAKKLAAAGRVQQTASGRKTMWLCPSHAENRKLELGVLKEMAQRYGVDGIHLDYIRFADSVTCYCPVSRAAFEASLGRKVAKWPADVQARGALEKDFRRWRAEEITSFVREARRELRAVNPKVKLSAAVYGNYPDCAGSIGQDWGAWIKEGLVDFVCPMNYTEDPARFTAMTHAQLGLAGARGRVYPGLGVNAAESQLAADRVIEQIAALRKLGAGGFMLFKLDPTLRDRILPALSLGATRE